MLRRSIIIGTWCLLHAAPAFAEIERQNLPVQEEAPPEPVLTKPPELLEFVHPEYPPALKQQGISGGVVLRIDIDKSGAVSRVELLSTEHDGFNQPAMIAATRLVFSPAEVDYAPAPIRIEYRFVFEARPPEPDAIAGEPPPADDLEAIVNYRGVVREAGTRLPVRGATVTFLRRSTKTDDDGSFEFRGAPTDESFSVEVTSPFHHIYKAKETVATDELIEVIYYIRRSALDPYETIVRSKRAQREVSKISLSRKEFSRLPGTSGDPIRAIENLPGMARPAGGLGVLLVRGSSPEDSKIFIDGMEVPILYHFGGLTSVVSRYMLETIDVHPGAFPVRYGNATGGVVDVKTRELDCDLWRGAAEPSTAILQAYTCYPISDNVLVAGAARRSLLDIYLPEIVKAVQGTINAPDEGAIVITPAYADYQLKLEGAFADHLLTLFAFGSDDTLAVGQTPSTERLDFDFGFHQGFHRIMLRHRWHLTGDLSLTTTVAPGVILTEFSFSTDSINAIGNIYDYSVAARADLNWKLFDGLVLRAGFDGAFGQTDLAFELPLPDELRPFPSPIFDFGEPEQLAFNLPKYNHAYWADTVIEPGAGIQLVPGVRFSRWDFHHTQRESIEARVNTRWEFHEGMTAKLAYGLHERLPDVQNLLDRPFGNPNLYPERSHQFIVGYEHEFTDLFKVDLQAYYYRREQLASPALDVRFRDGERSPVSFLGSGGGQTIGLEILVRHLASNPRDFDTIEEIVDVASFLDALRGRFYGWIAYTLSQTMRSDHVPNSTYTIEQGPDLSSTFPYDTLATEPHPADFDQTHILTVVAQMRLPLAVEGGLRFRLISGNPYTPLHEGFIGVDVDADAYRSDVRDVGRNSGRMPFFHQLDLRFDKEAVFDLFKANVYLEIINLYAANNVDQQQYGYRYREKITTNLLPFPVVAIGAIIKW